MRNITGNPDFGYEIACTEVCGQGHFSMRIRLIVEDEASWAAWCKQQKPLLTSTPELAVRIPSNLKAKAAKYLPADATAAPADSSTASLPKTGGVTTAVAKLR